jgi:hypothetical protein
MPLVLNTELKYQVHTQCVGSCGGNNLHIQNISCTLLALHLEHLGYY